MGLILTALCLNTATNAGSAIAAASTELSFAEAIKTAVDIGITPALLIVFILYFLNKSKTDDARVIKAHEDAQQAIAETNEVIAKREQQLLEESLRREELIRQEAEKREALIRKESEKRESILMGNMERMIQSMETITQSMHNIDQSLAKVHERLEKIEGQANDRYYDNKRS